MVRTVNETLADNASMERPSLVVELVGPAGAGKTALLRTLSQRNKKILTGARPQVRRVGHIPFFVRNVLLLLPTFLHLYQHNSRWLTRREFAWMAILKGWPHVLGQEVSNEGTVVVLEHGPVFILANLLYFGPESLKGRSAEKWWRSMYTHWASILDMVVWLDASETILLERIRARNKWHRVKEKSEPEVFKFLSRYRAAYEQVISELTADGGGPKVLRFDTSQQSLDEIVNRILAEFGMKDGEEKSCVGMPAEPIEGEP